MLSFGRRGALAALLLAGTAAVGATPAARPLPEWSGRVTHVSDGDSLWVLPAEAGAKAVEIRLADIDAPELCQAWGPQARDALQAMVAGKTVNLQVVGHDVYGRTLAQASVDGLALNAQLVSEGQAWSQRTRWDQGPLVRQEKVARSLRRGLHAQPHAQMPRDFRKIHGPCTEGQAVDAAPARTVAPQPRGAAPAPAAGGLRCDGRIHCSQMSSCAEATYFLRNCPGVKMDGDGDGVPCETQWCRR